MIEIKCNHGVWNNYDWYLLNSSESSKFIFYAPTLKLSLLLNNELGSSILSSNILPIQISNKLELKKKNHVIPTIERPKAFHLAIGLTNNCSLGCLYCHAEADKKKKIDSRYINLATEYSFKNAGKTPRKILTVSFAVGGEPTLEWPLFKSTIKKIREYEQQNYFDVAKVYLSMTTNCYYGEAKRRFISDYFDTLTLSIDGPMEIHNIHRPTRNNNGSFEIVKKSCEYFINSTKIKVGLRSTVSSLNVRQLPNIVNYFHENFGNRYSITFEPLVQIGRALKNELESPNEEEFAHYFWTAYCIGKKLGIKVTSSGVNINRLITRYCGAMSIPSFTVCTDGTITACHRDQDGQDYKYGRIDLSTNQIIIDSVQISKNIKLTEIPDKCIDCFAKLHCAGDCPDIRRINYSRCNFNRYIIFKELEELHKNKINSSFYS